MRPGRIVDDQIDCLVTFRNGESPTGRRSFETVRSRGGLIGNLKAPNQYSAFRFDYTIIPWPVYSYTCAHE